MPKGVDKIRDQYSNDAEVARRSTKQKFAIIISNLDHLEKVDKNGKKEEFLDSITDDMENDRTLADWQVDQIEDLYEQMMRGAGLEYVSKHIDRKRKGINYGHQGK